MTDVDAGSGAAAPSSAAPAVASSEVDYQGIAIGPPKCGKTYLAASLNSRWSRRGEWCFVHDPNFNTAFRRVGFATYDDVGAWRRAARDHGAKKRPLPRGAVIGGDASELVELVDELGRKYNRADRVVWPMRLTLDEGSALGSSGSSWIGPREQSLCAQRRHRGVGLLFLAQDVTMLHPRFMSLSTRIYVFPGLSPAHLKVLERRVAMRTENPFRAVDCEVDPARRFFLVCKPQGGFTTEVE